MLGSEKPKIGTGSHGTRCQVHQVLVRDVAVREHHRVHTLCGNQLLEILLFEDWNPVGILQSISQFRRISAMRNVGNLGGGERHYLVLRITAKNYVEVMEVPAGRSCNKDSFHGLT